MTGVGHRDTGRLVAFSDGVFAISITHGTFRVYMNKGTFKGTIEGSGTPAADGSIDVSGTGEITKGTGKYKGAHGDFTMSGNRTTTGVTTLAITGRVKY